MQYIVLRCPKCGKIGTGMTRSVADYKYNCRRCGRQTKLKSALKFGLRAPLYASFDNERQAVEFCRKLNNETANVKLEQGWKT
jgi:hypothetical protein